MAGGSPVPDTSGVGLVGDRDLVRDSAGVVVASHGDGPPAQRLFNDPTLERVTATHFEQSTRAQVYRAPDLIDRWLRAEVISDDMASAGRVFQSAFWCLGLDALRAPDLGRIPGAGGGPGLLEAEGTAWAAEYLDDAFQALGGRGSPGANGMWYVIGLDLTIGQWADREVFGKGRTLRYEVARVILIEALGVLEAFEYARRGCQP